MDSKILIGGKDFEQVISSHSYYIDKIELIYDLFHNPNMVSLFTRPRRFGKTLNMSMIDNFFNIRKSTHSFRIFILCPMTIFVCNTCTNIL